MGKSIISGIMNTKGDEPNQPHRQRRSILSRSTYDCMERTGETRRDQDRGRIRDAFMEFKGIDRPTFESKHSRGAGYKEWRAFAAEHGLNLPA